MKMIKYKLKRFGKITDTISINFQNHYWKCKFGEDDIESNILFKLIYNKKEYPTIEDLPKEINIGITLIKAQKSTTKPKASEHNSR